MLSLWLCFILLEREKQTALTFAIIIIIIIMWPVCAVGPKCCYHILNWFFPSKAWFFRNLFEIFSSKNQFKKNQYLPHSESKSYQINSIKSCSSSRSFQQHHQRHIPIPPWLVFSYDSILIFSEKIHSIFKNFCTASPNVMEPSTSSPPHPELSNDTKNMM